LLSASAMPRRVAISRVCRGVLMSLDPAATRRLRPVVLGAVALLLVGCADEPALGIVRSEASVGDFEDTTCSTAVVVGLSQQVAEEVDCLMPGQMVRVEEQDGIVFNGAAVLPYLDAEARDDLYAAAVAGGRELRINSAFRSVVQQYLLRTWFEQGRCGIAAAAQPGRSNHEGGRAIDVDNWDEWVEDLPAHGWLHDVPGDDVHFDHVASPDIRGADVLAFQRLWNRNNPDDLIAEDGDYGPQTAARIAISPSEGFPIGAMCVDDDRGVDVLDVTGPASIGVGEHAVFTVRLHNVGTTTWPATAVLVTATGAPSELADDEAWISDSEVVALGADVPPGGELELLVDVVGPQVDVVTPIAERFAISDGSARFGAVPIAVTVDPEDPDSEPSTHAGCAAGGNGAGGAPIALAVLAIVGARGRRRRGPRRATLG
jgi:hypothetical protein